MVISLFKASAKMEMVVSNLWFLSTTLRAPDWVSLAEDLRRALFSSRGHIKRVCLSFHFYSFIGMISHFIFIIVIWSIQSFNKVANFLHLSGCLLSLYFLLSNLCKTTIILLFYLSNYILNKNNLFYGGRFPWINLFSNFQNVFPIYQEARS